MQLKNILGLLAVMAFSMMALAPVSQAAQTSANQLSAQMTQPFEVSGKKGEPIRKPTPKPGPREGGGDD